MVKKEASKGREWEKGRRDVLNQTFNELHQALPSYVVGQTLSKKTILIQALACIRELQQMRKGDTEDDQVFKSDHYKKWVQNILTKFNHLLSFLNTINIKVPEDCLSIDAPPPGISPDILQLLSKHEKARLSIGISSQENKSHAAQNADEVKKSDLSNHLYSASSSSHCTGSSPKKKVYSSSQCGKVCQSEILINESSESLIANPSVIQSRPLVVQSSSIQMPSQLLFTSNNSNSPLPLLVSVTGVKTVNPFILVQSNIMAPNPSAPQKLMRSGSSRHIQPCPTSKISRKPPKIPIPSLKQKLLLSGFSHPHGTQLKCLKKNFRKKSSKSSPEIKSEKVIRKNKFQKVKRPSNSTNATNMLVDSKLKKNSTSDMHVSNKTDQAVDGKPSGTVSDVNKENIVQCDPSSNANVDESNGNAFAPKNTSTSAENNGSVAGDMRVHSVPVCIMESPLENQETSAISTGKESNNILKKMTYESQDINCSKSQKCENKASQVKSSLEHVESHASKMTKSNYSISALCARQQLLQNTENTVLAEEPQETPNSKSSETQKAKLPSPNIENNNVPMVTSGRNLTDNCSIVKDKATVLASNNVCNEWSDKSKLKPDRPSTSFNIFSSLPLHNSKNTFIPINDIESFKPVPESFDSTDNSFGLPLQSTDISNDLFASLQVPSGGQHPESISPTAAFLLAFPLVSTSKATELDDTVCENTDSQPGMKTLLQIGNLDCDTPVTKCVSVFSSIENSNVVYSSSNVFNQETLTVSAVKNRNSTVDVLNFPAREATQKSNNENMISLKAIPNFGLKCPESSLSIKESVPFSAKEHYQAGCSSNNKRICASRTESSTILTVSNINGQPNGARVSTRNGTLLQESGSDKSPPKLIHPQENGGSITFLGCEKQSDWLEMPQAPLAIFPDYPPTSTSRSDCAVNYVLPPVLMSSSAGGEELLSLSRSQGSSSIPSSILSWSTISSGNIQSSTSTSKVANFQEIFPVSKALNKTIEFQHLVHNQNVSASSSQTQLITTSASTVSHKLNSVLSNYTEVLSSSSENDNALAGKQITHTQNFAPPENIAEERKPFLSVTATKDLICNSSEVPKMSSNFCGSTTHLQTRTGAAQSSSTKMMYLSSENKLSKANNVYFEEKVASQNVKMGMSASLNSSSKDSSSLLTYNQNNVVVAAPEVKQIHSNYSQIPTLNVKGAVGQNNIVGNNYNHQNNTLAKQSPGSGSHYSTGISSVADPKKDVTTFTHNSGASVEVLKQTTSSLHYNQENTSMLQFGSTSTNLASSHQGSYNSKPNNQNGQEDKSQPGQQRQLCVPANNKESVTNLHRPPVNWMTAPDIRSHQHHSGPSFGNSSNMNSTQGLLYLPEHIKESENIGPVFDQTANFHCLDMAHSSQPLYKGNEHHLFGNDSIENFHDNSAWSPSKSGGSSMLGNMMIPSTLPTLVGDLALGDNSISRPFLPTFNNDSQGCLKKPARRMINAPRRSDKGIDEASVTTATIGGQECAGSFLSVSQLVDTSNAVKSRTTTIAKESHLSYTGPFSDHDTASCQTSKQSTSKSVSSNYSTEALLSSTIPLQTSQTNNRKRRSHGTHYSNNYVGTSMPYQNTSSVSLQAQGPQNQYLSDLPRSNDYQGTFIPSDTVPPFILGNPTSRSHRNHSYSLQNVTDRTSVEDNSNPLKSHHPGGMLDNSTGRPRTNNHNSTSNGTSTVAVSSSSNIMDFGYMNMTSTVLQDDINFTNHPPPPPPPPPPSFLPHHSYSMPAAQDSLYSTPRLSMHPTHHPQNSNIQSPSATTLTNFHLSTIFPEINDKVIC